MEHGLMLHNVKLQNQLQQFHRSSCLTLTVDLLYIVCQSKDIEAPITLCTKWRNVTNIDHSVKSSASPGRLMLGFTVVGEEADAQILIYVNDMVLFNASKVKIQAVDCEVVIIATSYYFTLKAEWTLRAVNLIWSTETSQVHSCA